MSRDKYLNDSPILTPDDDQFGINSFAKSLAESIKTIKSPEGITIALNGQWGSGKSSALNLILHHLQSDIEDRTIVVMDFKCWWFRGEEALTLAFLQDFNALLRDNIGDQVKDLVPKIGRFLLQSGSVVGPVATLLSGPTWTPLMLGSMTFAKRFFPKGKTIEKLFDELSNALDNQSKRFLVVIDDIDRLTPNDALLVFRLIKSVGRLPNVIYLLAFDRNLAEKSIKKEFPSEGSHFLEKIIQVSFDLPLPSRNDLESAVLANIEKCCGSPKEGEQEIRFMNVFYDAVFPYFKTPRDIIRFSNSIRFSWPSVANEVDMTDFVTLEVIRLFETSLYNKIRLNKDRIFGSLSSYHIDDSKEDKINYFLNHISDNERKRKARIVLLRLFPGLISKNLPTQTNQVQRLISLSQYFDIYFNMGIGDNSISKKEVEEFISKCGNKDFVLEAFVNAATSFDKKGNSKASELLDEIKRHSCNILKPHVLPLLTGIFEIADDIHKVEDKILFHAVDSFTRINWLIRELFCENYSLDEQDQILVEACKEAQVGWLVYFTCSAISCYKSEPEIQSAQSETCLVKKESLPTLKDLCIQRIQESIDSEKLIHHKLLSDILFQWKDLQKDSEVDIKRWTSEQMSDARNLSLLAKAFTNISLFFSSNSTELFDRIATPRLWASVKDLETILDIREFRRRLEECENSQSIDPQSKEYISNFLTSWRNQEESQ